MEITNKIFENLMKTKKKFNETPVALPGCNQKLQLEVSSMDNKESFIVDVDRSGKIEMKSKVQERYLNNQILIRVEVNAPPHTNPDGSITSRNHIHIYQEGYNISWAYDLEEFDENLFNNLKNFNKVFIDFCSYCNIELNDSLQMVI